MTNPTPHGQVPEALRLADEWQRKTQREADRRNSAYDHYGMGNTPETVDPLGAKMTAELRRLHAYCQELEAHVIFDCMTHVQNPAENEHVASDVSKNGAEVNMTGSAMRASHGQAPARADMQDAYVGAREDLAIWKRRALEAERDLRAERETTSRLAAEINAINGPTHLGEPSPTAQAADSVLEDVARRTTGQEHAIRQGHEIAASDGYFEARPQIDSNDRRKVFQAGFERGWDAASKQGENHD